MTLTDRGRPTAGRPFFRFRCRHGEQAQPTAPKPGLFQGRVPTRLSTRSSRKRREIASFVDKYRELSRKDRGGSRKNRENVEKIESFRELSRAVDNRLQLSDPKAAQPTTPEPGLAQGRFEACRSPRLLLEPRASLTAVARWSCLTSRVRLVGAGILFPRYRLAQSLTQ